MRCLLSCLRLWTDCFKGIGKSFQLNLVRPEQKRLRMQVVLFCGGQGVRMRDYTKPTDAESFLPKPLVHIGYRPMLWYIMKYYASYGHTDFILALGYKQDLFKEYWGDICCSSVMCGRILKLEGFGIV